ncbi:amidohydrolase family protein [Sphingobacterium pedocola]|uniref:Amidohydrolase n=1 Tax=Sphingobacterium pedocola TaxID=2082722 RepID=A0ABR9T7A5_9SPHI|nr:amidohydrolase family protein [Sphingobacterium pedocola]MBE8720547.1 amidohydrolase [Sphingobacterium pedocola]
MRIDAHQHFWIYDKVKDSWITDDMAVIQRDFLPNDLSSILKENKIDGTVAVQASQSTAETKFLVDLSKVYALIKGVVGWVDLQAENIDEQLQEYTKEPIIKGFRHIIQGEEDPDFILGEAFQRGIKALTKYGYTYDLLIRPHHFPSTLACVAANPEQKFVLDHIAKPDIKNGGTQGWSEFITALAKYKNVSCKISGLVTEADWKNWKIDNFASYIAHTVNSFGTERIMFGSDWPVMLLAASYTQGIEILDKHMVPLTEAELNAFWGENAAKFYNLK